MFIWHQVTRLVPSLRPSQECTMVPSQTCTMNYANQRVVEKPLKTEWCLDQESMDNDIRNVVAATGDL